jgi:Protein of unknown function (DUF4231)
MANESDSVNTGNSIQKTVWDWVKSIWKFFWDIVRSVFTTLRAFIFLFSKTFSILVPSAALTSGLDDKYNKTLAKQLSELVKKLELEDEQKQVILNNWIEQLEWTNSRATRERDANELIRWWQIILGILIPVLANRQDLIFLGVPGPALAGIAGVFVAVLTAIAQFRRPEERWRHYRVITEHYLTTIWNFITLSSDDYKDTSDHKGAFKIFDKQMMSVRNEDLTKFFGEVVPSNAYAELNKRIEEMQIQLAKSPEV